MPDLKRYLKLKERVEDLQRQKDRSVGAVEQLEAQLKRDFKCSNLKEGKALKDKLEKECTKLEKEFDEMLRKFEGEYGEMLK